MKSRLGFLVLFILLAGVLVYSLVSSPSPKKAEQLQTTNATTTEAEKKPVPILVHLMRPGDGESDLSLFVIRELAREFKGLFILRNINVDKEPEASSFYQINNIPTLILLAPDKKVFYRHEGYLEKQILLKKIKLAAEQT